MLAMRKRVLGAEHSDTLTTAHNLAICLSLQGKHAEAEEMEREVLTVRKQAELLTAVSRGKELSPGQFFPRTRKG